MSSHRSSSLWRPGSVHGTRHGTSSSSTSAGTFHSPRSGGADTATTSEGRLGTTPKGQTSGSTSASILAETIKRARESDESTAKYKSHEAQPGPSDSSAPQASSSTRVPTQIADDPLLKLVSEELERRRKRQKLYQDDVEAVLREVEAADKDLAGDKRMFDRFYGESLDGIDYEEFFEYQDEFRGRADYIRALQALRAIMESSRQNSESFERAANALKEAAQISERAALANECAALANERAVLMKRRHQLEDDGEDSKEATEK